MTVLPRSVILFVAALRCFPELLAVNCGLSAPPFHSDVFTLWMLHVKSHVLFVFEIASSARMET